MTDDAQRLAKQLAAAGAVTFGSAGSAMHMGNQAAALDEGAAFGTDETIVDAVREARIASPDRLDHLDFIFILGIAPYERTAPTVRGIGIERGWRHTHMWNIMGTRMSRKGKGMLANVQ